MSFRRILSISLIVLAPAVASAQDAASSSPVAPAPRPKPAQLPSDSMEIGRKLAQWFYRNQLDSMVAHMDPASRANPQAKEQLAGSLAQLSQRAGLETDVVEEKYITRNGARQYWRIAKFSGIDEPIVIRFIVTAKGEMAGFGMQPLRQAPAIDP